VAASPTAATQVLSKAAPAPSHDEPAIHSRVLGRYRIEAELGRGAMGVVFRAWDENLERTVAIKVLARAVREIPQAMSFFVQEAKALAQLNHPNIVAVHDQVTDATDTYIIMEYVDGTTLDRLLHERGTLPLRTALGVVDQLCNGLGYAHAKKVIHRDIKPANVFVSRDKVVKLGDFGIARVMRELEIRQTDVRGTPLYMAPEQINGTNINHRADLYAVGCTLFELCAGRPPFLDGAVMAHHLFTAPPPLSSFCAAAPPALDELLVACLAKDSSERIGSAVAIQERLRAIAADLPR
jgi:eukaryotic-like serine/threonine-protein kinase